MERLKDVLESPRLRGALSAAGLVGGLVLIAATVLFPGETSPGPDVFSALAQIGATLLVAYGIEMAWVSRARAEDQDWLGFVVGIGLCAVVGVFLSLAAAGLTNEQTTGWLVRAALAAGAAPAAILGVVIALYPLMIIKPEPPQG
jgi:hypothetical protein